MRGQNSQDLSTFSLILPATMANPERQRPNQNILENVKSACKDGAILAVMCTFLQHFADTELKRIVSDSSWPLGLEGAISTAVWFYLNIYIGTMQPIETYLNAGWSRTFLDQTQNSGRSITALALVALRIVTFSWTKALADEGLAVVADSWIARFRLPFLPAPEPPNISGRVLAAIGVVWLFNIVLSAVNIVRGVGRAIWGGNVSRV